MSSQAWITVGGRGVVDEQRVERGDAVRLGGRDGEAPADVVQGAAGDPALVLLDRLEGRQQEVAPRPGRVPAVGHVPLARLALAAGPARRGTDLGIEDRVDRRTLAGRGSRADDVQVHGGRVYAAVRRVEDAASSGTT